MRMKENIYSSLKPIEDFQSILDQDFFIEVPQNWWVVVTDVVNSTGAIESGRYKDVNIAGGLSAMALSNYFQTMDLPFLFGGDGITFLIPDELVAAARSILSDTRKKVREFYSLDLRIGMVSVSELKKKSHSVYLSKFKVSQYYYQAIIKGSGVEYAEKLVKKIDSSYLIPETEPITIEADFSGFTCRWKDIPSPNGETISLIIRVNESNDSNFSSGFFMKLERILGKESEYHPLKEESLEIARSVSILSKEAVVRANGSRVGKVFSLLRIYFETWVVKIVVLLKLNFIVSFYNLKNIKQYQIDSSDYRKFDGSLKMVISLDKEKRQKLIEFLDSQEKANKLLYGIHISDRALMTCLMHSGSKREVHFVDAADGGYAMAAKMLKLKY